MNADSFPSDRGVASGAALTPATVRERPILFSGAMVRALLAGTKTQTRRALRVQPDAHHWEFLPGYELKRSKIVTINDRCAVKFSHSIPQNPQWDTALDWLLCPYGQPGDRLWVREAFMHEPADYCWEASVSIPCRPANTVYRADFPGSQPGEGWKPSIHMPRKLSRIDLEVTDVRVERLQDISTADCWAEGIPSSPDVNPRHEYQDLWESINGPGSWDTNPWLWVVEFKRITPGTVQTPTAPIK